MLPFYDRLNKVEDFCPYFPGEETEGFSSNYIEMIQSSGKHLPFDFGERACCLSGNFIKQFINKKNVDISVQE